MLLHVFKLRVGRRQVSVGPSSLAILVLEQGKLTADQAAKGLAATYPWKWDWHVMVCFPSAARVE